MKKVSKRTSITIGVSLILIGIAFISSEYLTEKKHGAYERMTFEISENMPTEIENPGDENITDSDRNDTEIVDKKEVYVNHYNYIGRLEIPKIKLIKGFVSKDSSANNINENITIINPSDYPNIDKGNFILAGHTGTCWNCYFKNLYKLKNGDLAHIYYNNEKYTYKLTRFYYEKKTGTATIYRNMSKTTLTLITCTKGDKTSQTIFIFELQNKEKIK